MLKVEFLCLAMSIVVKFAFTPVNTIELEKLCAFPFIKKVPLIVPVVDGIWYDAA